MAVNWSLQLVNNPEYRRASDVTVPPEYNVPNESPRPMFLQVDFGLVRNANGELEPKLVELQAFPSLYGYQALPRTSTSSRMACRRSLGSISAATIDDSYWQLMRELIVADHDPENVILMEIDPENQKTLPRFSHHAAQARHRDRRYSVAGEARPTALLSQEAEVARFEVRRIYNRCIVDELERKGITLPFDLPRGARCRVGRPSQLVLPHQQVLHSVSEASDAFRRPGSSISFRELAAGQRELSAEAALFLCRSRHQVRSHAVRRRRHSARISAITTFFRSACSSSR